MTTVGTRPWVHFASPDVTEEDVAAVVEVLRSGWLTTGQVARDLEKALAERLGVRHVLATSSCTTALECAVAALRLPPGARVAVPSWTFISTVTVLLRLGLQPVLVDADPTSLNLAPASFARAVESGLSAALVVHFAGTPVDPAIFATALADDLPVVEDCAHALGTVLPRERGSRAGCYSFYATKNLTTAEGGAVATDDDDVADFVRSYRLHGMSSDAWRRYEPGGSPVYDLEHRGIKANLPDLLAALGRSQLRRFDDLQARRRSLVQRYRVQLAGLPDVELVPRTADPASADHLLVVLLPEGSDRDQVLRSLADDGVMASVHFQPVHRFRALHGQLDLSGGLDVCDALWPRALSLPLHPGLHFDDVDRVVTSLAGALRPATIRTGA